MGTTKKKVTEVTKLPDDFSFHTKDELLAHLSEVKLTEDDVFFVEIFEGKKVVGYTYEYHKN